MNKDKPKNIFYVLIIMSFFLWVLIWFWLYSYLEKPQDKQWAVIEITDNYKNIFEFCSDIKTFENKTWFIRLENIR